MNEPRPIPGRGDRVAPFVLRARDHVARRPAMTAPSVASCSSMTARLLPVAVDPPRPAGLGEYHAIVGRWTQWH